MNDNKREVWRPFKGVLLSFLILGIMGISFFFWKYDDVFPAASLNLKLSKQEVKERASLVSEHLGYPTKGCIAASTFGERSEIATFLEREYSMREANALMQSEINVFFWYTRFCKEQEEEEFEVWLDPAGKLVGVNHVLEKERKLPSLSEDEAMSLALKFVKEEAGIDLYEKTDNGPILRPGVKLIKKGVTKQLNRSDHYFTWEDQRKSYKDGFLRNSVEISGNLISSFNTELHVPEAFERKFNDMRSYNNLLKSLSSILFAVVGAGMVFAFFWALSAKKVRWRLLLLAGIASFSIELLDYWNNYQSILQSYNSSESLQGYLTSRLILSLQAALGAGFAAAMLVGGVEAVYRQKFPKAIALEHFLNWKLYSNHKLLETVMAGICIFGVHIGYVALFYLSGQKLGFWSPLEVRDVAALSGISPAFSSFAVGVNASVSEEFLYRILCFVLAQSIFKNFWIANLVQAAGWAFMHSDYPQEPAYARGVELTIVGLFYGYLMRRYGVMAGIISHFIYDAFLGVTPLLLSHSVYLPITGILACAPPFIVLGIGLLRRGKGGQEAVDEDLYNENLVKVPEKLVQTVEAAPEEEHLSISSLSARTKTITVLLCILSILVILFVHPRRMGSWARISKTQAEIVEIARNFLKERGVSEGDWKVSATLNANIDEDEVQYGFEKEGYKKTEQIMKAARIPMLWWVRFYKAKQRREYDVAVSSEGRPVALQVLEEEEAEGKSLSQEEAKRLTLEFLKKYRPEFSPLEYDSALEQKRKKRTDYAVSYVVPSYKMGDARLLISVDTVGGLVSFPHVTWDIPDSWRFERSKKTIKDHIAQGASQILVVICGVLLLAWTVRLFRSTPIHWRAAIIAGAAAALIALVNQANEFVYNLCGYDTDVPFASFVTRLAINAVVSSIFYAAVFSVLFAMAHAAMRLILPGVSLASIFRSLFNPLNENAKETRLLWLQGVWSAVVWVCGFNACSILISYLEGRFSPDVLVVPLQSLVSLTRCSSPAIDQVSGALTVGLASLCLAPVLLGIYLRYLRGFWRYFFVSLVVAMILGSTTKHWQDYLIGVGSSAVLIGAFYFWMKHCAGRNPLAYFLVAYLNLLAVSFFQMNKYAATVYPLDIGLLLVFILLPVVLPFLLFRGDGKSKSGS